jgi:hypothetical protein
MDGSTPWNEAVVCAACGTGLLPLTYDLPEDDDLREQLRPHLKCIGCGLGHRWHGSDAWLPVDSP